MSEKEPKVDSPLPELRRDAPAGPPPGLGAGRKGGAAPERPSAEAERRPVSERPSVSERPTTPEKTTTAPERPPSPEKLSSQAEKEPEKEEQPSEKELEKKVGQAVREHARKRGLFAPPTSTGDLVYSRFGKAFFRVGWGSGIGALALIFGQPWLVAGAAAVGTYVLTRLLTGWNTPESEKKAVRRFLGLEKESPTPEPRPSEPSATEPRPSEPEGALPQGQKDETRHENFSELTLAEAIRRGVLEPNVLYRSSGGWYGGFRRYIMTERNIERMKVDSAYREKLLRGGSPSIYRFKGY